MSLDDCTKAWRKTLSCWARASSLNHTNCSIVHFNVKSPWLFEARLLLISQEIFYVDFPLYPVILESKHNFSFSCLWVRQSPGVKFRNEWYFTRERKFQVAREWNFLRKMFLNSDWLNCASKSNPGCWFVLKGNVKEAFPFMPKFSSSLTVYIYFEVLESSLFIFLCSWTQVLVFNRIFHSLDLKTS